VKGRPGSFDLVRRHPKVADHLLHVRSHDLRVLAIEAVMPGHAGIVRPREHVGGQLEAGAVQGFAHPLLGWEVEDAADVEKDRLDQGSKKTKAPPKRGLQR